MPWSCRQLLSVCSLIEVRYFSITHAARSLSRQRTTPMHAQDRTILDKLSQLTSLRPIKSRNLAWRLAVHQTGWTLRIEP